MDPWTPTMPRCPTMKFLLLCSRMLAYLLALLVLPAAALAQQRVMVTYADAFLSHRPRTVPHCMISTA